MPIISEIKTGKDLDKKSIYNKMAWLPCEKCGKERWVWLKYGEPQYLVCHKCALSIRDEALVKNPNWKSGKITTYEGYTAIKLHPQDPLIAMATKARYVLEHRLVMARNMGRPLLKTELVHHKNGIKTDNHLENLELISRDNHRLKTEFCKSCPLMIAKVSGVAV